MFMRSPLWLLSLFLCSFSVGNVFGEEQQPFTNRVMNDDDAQVTAARDQLEVRRYQVQDPQAVLKISQELDLDVWRLTSTHLDVRLPADTEPFNLPYTVLPLPAHTYEEPTPPPQWNLSTLTNNTFHQAYHPLAEITSFIHQLVTEYPENVQIVDIGKSSEGRDMLGLVISSTKKHGRGGRNKKPKPVFLIQGAQHAREWVATATALYMAHALVVSKTDPHSKVELLDVFDFHIMPSPNPDGYDYTWVNDRFFYKNRQPVSKGSAKCVGIDMNRNWGYKWLPPAADSDPCSHWYPGSRAFEAPEVNNIANYVTYRAPAPFAFLDLRAYGQMLSSPYSYSCDVLPANAENLIEAALGGAQALHKLHGTIISTGRLCEQLYSAPGNVLDWMHDVAGVKYSYVAHLRDTGTYGFALPPRLIQPVGEETSALLNYLVKFMAKHHKL